LSVESITKIKWQNSLTYTESWKHSKNRRLEHPTSCKSLQPFETMIFFPKRHFTVALKNCLFLSHVTIGLIVTGCAKNHDGVGPVKEIDGNNTKAATAQNQEKKGGKTTTEERPEAPDDASADSHLSAHSHSPKAKPPTKTAQNKPSNSNGEYNSDSDTEESVRSLYSHSSGPALSEEALRTREKAFKLLKKSPPDNHPPPLLISTPPRGAAQQEARRVLALSSDTEEEE
jgi:hypothetical protein